MKKLILIGLLICSLVTFAFAGPVQKAHLLYISQQPVFDLFANFQTPNQTFNDTDVLSGSGDGVQRGSLTVVKTGGGGSSVKSVDGELELVGSGSNVETGGVMNAITKALGKGVFFQHGANASVSSRFGLHDSAVMDPTPDAWYAWRKADDTYSLGSAAQELADIVSTQTYSILLLLGGNDSSGVPFKSGDTVGDFLYGVRFFIRDGTFTTWTLLWLDPTDNTSTLYPQLNTSDVVDKVTFANIDIPEKPLNVNKMFQPRFLATYQGTNGDSIRDVYEPDVVNSVSNPGVTALESGADTWDIQSNQARNTPGLAGEQASGNITAGVWYKITATEVDTFFTGCAVGDYFMAFNATGLDANNKVQAVTTNEIGTSDDMGTSEGIFDVSLIVAADNPQAGLRLFLDSVSNPQNFIDAYYDQVDAKVKLHKVVGGSPTSLISVSKAYSASAQLRVIASKDGSDLLVRLYYAGEFIGTEQTVSDAGIVDNTDHGGFSVDSGNSLDNFSVMPRSDPAWDIEISRGTGGVY